MHHIFVLQLRKVNSHFTRSFSILSLVETKPRENSRQYFYQFFFKYLTIFLIHKPFHLRMIIFLLIYENLCVSESFKKFICVKCLFYYIGCTLVQLLLRGVSSCLSVDEQSTFLRLEITVVIWAIKL